MRSVISLDIHLIQLWLMDTGVPREAGTAENTAPEMAFPAAWKDENPMSHLH